MFNKITLIGRLGQNAEAKTAQNNREFVVLNIATQESWKNDKGEYETRTEWHRVYAWRNLSKFAKTLQKGQLVTLEGTLKYRDVEDDVEGTPFKHGSQRSMPPASSGSPRSKPLMIQPMQPATSNRRRRMDGADRPRPSTPEQSRMGTMSFVWPHPHPRSRLSDNDPEREVERE